MTEQKADTEELATLMATMSELATYCDALKNGAGNFVYMLPAEWQGPAASNFMALFETWAGGAAQMTLAAQELEKQAKVSKESYETVDTDLDTTWNETKAAFA